MLSPERPPMSDLFESEDWILQEEFSKHIGTLSQEEIATTRRIVEFFFDYFHRGPCIDFEELWDKIGEPAELVFDDARPGIAFDQIGGWEIEFPIPEKLHDIAFSRSKLLDTEMGCLPIKTIITTAVERSRLEERTALDNLRGCVYTMLGRVPNLRDIVSMPSGAMEELYQRVWLSRNVIFSEVYVIGTRWLLEIDLIGDMQNKIKRKFGKEVLIIDMKNINKKKRSAMIFAPSNNYGFLVFDLKKEILITGNADYMKHLSKLRIKLREGDLYHLPLRKDDIVLDWNMPTLGTSMTMSFDGDTRQFHDLTTIREHLLEKNMRNIFKRFLLNLPDQDRAFARNSDFIKEIIVELIFKGVPTCIRVPAVLPEFTTDRLLVWVPNDEDERKVIYGFNETCFSVSYANPGTTGFRDEFLESNRNPTSFIEPH